MGRHIKTRQWDVSSCCPQIYHGQNHALDPHPSLFLIQPTPSLQSPFAVNGTLHPGLSRTSTFNLLLSHVHSTFTITLRWLSRPHILSPAKLDTSLFLPHTMSTPDQSKFRLKLPFLEHFFFSFQVQILVILYFWLKRLPPPRSLPGSLPSFNIH